MNNDKPIMLPPNSFKLPPNVAEHLNEDEDITTVYLRSEGTEAFRVRIDRETRKAINSTQTAYGLMMGKTPSLSLLVRRALAAHFKDTVDIMTEGSEAERRAHIAKLLEGRQ